MKKYILISIATFFFVFGCERNNTIDNIQVESREAITTVNGILKFQNYNVFKETLDSISHLNPKDYLEWMDKINFVSIQSKYWNLINEEIEYDRKNEVAYMQGSDIFSTKEHSELYYKLLREEFIKESFDEEEGITTHDLNISSPFLASILNLEGVYMIADTIIQSTPTTLKYWINGDINNLSKLLNTDESSSDIQIFKLTSTKKSSFDPNPKQGLWENPTNDPTRKIKLYLYFETWQYLGDGTIWRYQHYINVKSQKKNWLGQWKYNWTDMYIKGSWSGDFQYTDPYNSLIIRNYDFSAVFPSNYPSTYNVYASDLYCSLSIIDGSTSPHLATFGLAIYLNGAYRQIWDVSVDDGDWEARGHVSAVSTINF